MQGALDGTDKRTECTAEEHEYWVHESAIRELRVRKW